MSPVSSPLFDGDNRNAIVGTTSSSGTSSQISLVSSTAKSWGYNELDGDIGVGVGNSEKKTSSMYSKWAYDSHPSLDQSVNVEPATSFDNIGQGFPIRKPMDNVRSEPNVSWFNGGSYPKIDNANVPFVGVQNVLGYMPPAPPRALPRNPRIERPEQVYSNSTSGMVYPGDVSNRYQRSFNPHEQVNGYTSVVVAPPVVQSKPVVIPEKLCLGDGGDDGGDVSIDSVPGWAASEVDHPARFSLLSMKRSLDGEYYLSVPDVFRHVTLGGRLKTVDLLELGKLVSMIVCRSHHIASLDSFKIDKVRISKDSEVIYVNKYGWTDYPYMAEACLRWMSVDPTPRPRWNDSLWITPHPEKVIWC